MELEPARLMAETKPEAGNAALAVACTSSPVARFVIVLRPVASAAETSVTRIATPGISEFTIVDLPMPDWPTSTVRWWTSQWR